MIHGIARAVLRGGEMGDITLYNEDDDVLAVVTNKASLGLDGIELELEQV